MALTAITRGMQNAAPAIQANFNEIEQRLNARTNDALWQGNIFMSASHSITPSKGIRSCQNGWVLKWNPYNSTSGGHWSESSNYTLIPKQHVETDGSGSTVICPVGKKDGTVVGAKVVIVSPAAIKGQDVNAVGTLYGYVLTGIFEF